MNFPLIFISDHSSLSFNCVTTCIDMTCLHLTRSQRNHPFFFPPHSVLKPDKYSQCSCHILTASTSFMKSFRLVITPRCNKTHHSCQAERGCIVSWYSVYLFHKLTSVMEGVVWSIKSCSSLTSSIRWTKVIIFLKIFWLQGKWLLYSCNVMHCFYFLSCLIGTFWY